MLGLGLDTPMDYTHGTYSGYLDLDSFVSTKEPEAAQLSIAKAEIPKVDH